MSLDTKYRPLSYDDVLGQQNTIKILRKFVSSGQGFNQSYLFAGQFGSGKTTIGRILARSLLCENPSETGDACNECPTCKSLIESGSSSDFVEVDAATNSGKADIKKITEEIQYSTFSGKQRIYLFDESHQLSRDALDAMLKPLEENIPGTDSKKLVCIFCTTEPEKMRSTVLSRCAPAFIVQAVTPQEIAGRLEFICKSENIEYDPDVLVLIAESVECHIRDAIKAIEGVSLLGPINKKNVVSYLRLDLNTAYLDVVENIGSNLSEAIKAVKRILERTSPVTCYEKLADVAMMIHHVSLGVMKPPLYWDVDQMKRVGEIQSTKLLNMANLFASRPGRATQSMLLCDVSLLHQGGVLIPNNPHPLIQQESISIQPPITEKIKKIGLDEQKCSIISVGAGNVSNNSVLQASVIQGDNGVCVDDRAVGKKSHVTISGGLSTISSEMFSSLLGKRLLELGGYDRSTRRNNLGSGGIDIIGGSES